MQAKTKKQNKRTPKKPKVWRYTIERPQIEIDFEVKVRQWCEDILLPVVFDKDSTDQMKKEALGIVFLAIRRGFLKEIDFYGYCRK